MEQEQVGQQELQLSRAERVLFYLSITISALILLLVILNNGFSVPGGSVNSVAGVCKMVSYYSLFLSLIFIFSGSAFLVNGSGKGYYFLLPGVVIFTNAVILESIYTFIRADFFRISGFALLAMMLFILVAGFFGFVAVWLLKLRVRFGISKNRFVMIICLSVFWLFTQIIAIIIPKVIAWNFLENF